MSNGTLDPRSLTSEGGKVEMSDDAFQSAPFAPYLKNCPNCLQPGEHEFDEMKPGCVKTRYTCERKPAQPEPVKRFHCAKCYAEVNDPLEHWDGNENSFKFTCKRNTGEPNTRPQPAQPEPVAAYHAAPMMGFPCANCGQETLRMDGHVSHRASGDETEYYCDKLSRPEPVAAEMPDLIRKVVQALRVVPQAYGCEPLADALESFWRTHAAQPAKVRMTEELEEVLNYATIYAGERGIYSLQNDIAAVRAQAAEAGKVRLPAELEALLRTFASGQGINVARLRELCRTVFAELDAAEGRK